MLIYAVSEMTANDRPETTDESRKRWDQNAEHWDMKMGEFSNQHFRELVCPDTERLLGAKAEDKILDVACGNGNFSKRLAEIGTYVTAFDYSEKIIRNARKRYAHYLDKIDFRVIDATKYDELITLGEKRYDKTVCNMGIHDIADIKPLFVAVHDLLKPNGIFVFSVMHPCFRTPGMQKIVETEEIGDKQIVRNLIQISNYITPQKFEGTALLNQPVPHIYYHRPLSQLLKVCFDANFLVNGFSEPVFNEKATGKFDWTEIPAIIIMRIVRA